MPRPIRNPVASLILGVLLAAPRTTLACSVCMGGGDSEATQGLNAAILTLLTALLLVLGGTGGFLAYLIRRSIKHPLAQPAAPRGVVR